MTKTKIIITGILLLIIVTICATFFLQYMKADDISVLTSVIPTQRINSIIKETLVIDKETDFPSDMELLDPEGACVPELTHFDTHFFIDPNRTYTEKDLEVLSDPQLRTHSEYLAISSSNSSESITCSLHSMYPAYSISSPFYNEDFRFFTVYKMPDSNLYVGTIFSKDSEKEILGKIMIKFLGTKLNNGLEVSIGYFDEMEFNDFYALNSGRYTYEYALIDEGDIASINALGKQVFSKDYSSYNGTWYSTYSLELEEPNFNALDLNIQPNGQVSGHIIQATEIENEYTFYGEADLYGHTAGSQIFLHYDDDGYGHSGDLTITLYENGIISYLVEHGEPSWSNGFFTGSVCYFRK